MWNKRDWHDFFKLVTRRWERHRPPRPVYLSGQGRVTPAAGFSLEELDGAGISVELAERLGLPVDAGRTDFYGPNVSALRDYLRAARGRG